MSEAQRKLVAVPIRILVVDDDNDTLRLLSRNLKSQFGTSVDVHTLNDARDAATYCLEKQIEILLTDLNMDDVNGLHLLKRVKSQNPLVQVILMTASDSPNAIRSALAMGADDYFLKPVKPAAIMDCLAYLNNRVRRWHREVPGLMYPIDAPAVVTS